MFIVAGLIFACTAATYSEGTVRFPEAGGSSSFARHAFDELVSFTAAWAQMLVYVVTVAVSAFFVPHYLSIFWEPLRTNPWDIVGGAIVILILVALNVVGVSEAAKLSVTLAVLDLATQVLLVLIGFALVFNPGTLVDNVHWGVAPTWSTYGTHCRHTAQTIYQHLIGLGVAVDVVVATDSDLQQYGQNFSLVYYPALREGRAIYAA